jgi:flagellin
MSTFSINTNPSSLIAQRNYAAANGLVSSSLQKMATGSRINRGADDPAGLISSEQLSAALASLDAESSGMDRADAVANVADGALSEVSGLLSDANAAAVANANTGGMSQA